MLTLAFGFLTLDPMPPGYAADATGNPLWAVPMRALSVTRDRPIFSPTRRPPSPPAIAHAAAPPQPASARVPEPDRPPLSVLGTVVSRRDSIGIFMEDAGKNVLRLHAGQDYAGWVLRTVQRREVKFEKGTMTARLSLPAAREQPAATPIAGAPSTEKQRVPPAPAAVAQVAASPVVLPVVLPERRRRD